MVRFVFLFLLSILSFSVFSQSRRAVTPPTKEYTTHLNAAKAHGIKNLKDKKVLNKYVVQGKLVKVKQRGYGYRLDKFTHSHPYLVSKANRVLDEIAREFVRKSGQNFFVVTSLTRTQADQNRLRRVNVNASSNDSSHCFGAAIDISYIRFNHKRQVNHKLDKHLESVLKDFQKAGKIYFVKERVNRCYHIIVR
ncbi:MAG TPA: DUF5715 family protein [Flavobacterium sp.]|nr:DUF5715 family protein [Flavobacterium sp.]